MSKVTFDISLSLDGFMQAANARPEQPMGDGGERLHAWAFDGDEADRQVVADGGADSGAVIAGRRTYDDSLPWWGADGPTGNRRLPVVVLTHRAPAESPEDGVYVFAEGGVEDALERARDAAGGKGITIMGGAETGRAFIAAGLVDELSLHVAPVLLGSGTRMFGEAQLALEPLATVQTPNATHLRFRVLR